MPQQLLPDPSKTTMRGVVPAPKPPEDGRPLKRWAFINADGRAFPIVSAREMPTDPGTWEEVAASVQAFDRKVNGVWTPEDQTADYWRGWRDAELADTDWLVTRATETQQPVEQVWLDYRQALRDIPEQPGFPTNVTRPVRPQ